MSTDELPPEPDNRPRHERRRDHRRQLKELHRAPTGTSNQVAKINKQPKTDTYRGKPHWNGEPCDAIPGTVVIGPSPKPTWWSAPHEGKRWACLKVTSEGQTFYLADHDGSATRKVFWEGGGWRSGHYSISNPVEGTFEPGDNLVEATCPAYPDAEGCWQVQADTGSLCDNCPKGKDR